MDTKAEELIHLMGVDKCRALLSNIDEGNVSIEELCEKGITEEDIRELKALIGSIKKK